MKNETKRQVSRAIKQTSRRLALILICFSAAWIVGNPSVSKADQTTARMPDATVAERVVDYPTVNRGFVFVNGSYLSPPYEFVLRGDELSINGHSLVADELILEAFLESEVLEGDQDLAGQANAGATLAPRARLTPMHVLADAAHATAQIRGIVVLAQGEAPLLLDDSRSGHELLVAMLERQVNPSAWRAAAAIPSELHSDAERTAWQRIVSDFSINSGFVLRARESVGEVRSAATTGDRVAKASLWADNIAYPLTLFAMIVVVVAFGHLLSNKPYLESAPDATGASPEARKVVLKSLLIFGLLSIVDLVWTIVASATGSMREMNPLGNDLINDPMRLIVFKAMAVTLSITLLYALHRRPIAQMASWWSCLVLTLLTARWLTFNSMFM